MKFRLKDVSKRALTRQAVLVFALLFAAVGAVIQHNSHAITPTASLQPEQGTRSASVVTVADASASSGNAVKFTAVSKTFGFAENGLLSKSAAAQATALDDMKSMGMTWLRTDLAWKSLQPTTGSAYNWGLYDGFVAAAQLRGIRIIGILDYAPNWAAASGCLTAEALCPPANTTQFTDYVTATVNHYKTMGVTTWEVWNEPNIPLFWSPTPNAASYTQLLKSAYTTIKGIDSTATVLLSGLAPTDTSGVYISPEDFLSGVYASGGKNYFDAVSAHPYSYPAAPGDTDAWSGWQRMLNLRSVMAAQGDSAKKIWITEFGAPTNGPGLVATQTDRKYDLHPDHVDEAYQAYIYQRAIELVRSYDWTGPVLFYQYQDLSTSTSTNENFFGIKRFDGSAKPAYTAIRTLLSQ